MRGGRRTAVRQHVSAGIALVLLGALAVSGAAVGLASESSPPHLSTDDEGAPMFAASKLTPGRRLTRCISVFHEGVAHPGELRLTGSASGTLARHLDLTVESGTGGRFGYCDEFVGGTRYMGTLRAFADAHGEPASGLVVPTASESATSFRFTIVVGRDSQAAGSSSSAAFVWRAEGVSVSTPGVPPDGPSVPPPTTAPPADDAPSAPAPAGGAAPGETAPSKVPGEAIVRPPGPAPPTEAAQPAAGTRPPTSPDGGGPETTAGDHDEAGAAVDEVAVRDWRTRLRELLGDIATVTAIVAESAAFPLLLLLLVVLFLAVQDRIDRNDPKLADAPVGADPDLEFGPPPSLQGGLR